MTQTKTVAGREMTPVQLGSAVVGVVFLLVGILGFIPGITTNYGDMTFASHESGALLLGIFGVNILHNIVHLLFGVVGLATARTASAAKYFLLIGGVIYLVLWIFGILIDQDSAINFVALNTPDNWLHFLLGVGMVVLGGALPGARR